VMHIADARCRAVTSEPPQQRGSPARAVAGVLHCDEKTAQPRPALAAAIASWVVHNQDCDRASYCGERRLADSATDKTTKSASRGRTGDRVPDLRLLVPGLTVRTPPIDADDAQPGRATERARNIQ